MDRPKVCGSKGFLMGFFTLQHEYITFSINNKNKKLIHNIFGNKKLRK